MKKNTIDKEILAKFNEDLNNNIKNLYNDVLITYIVTSSDDFDKREDTWKNELDKFIAEQEGKLKELFDENRPSDDIPDAAQSISEMAGGDPTKPHEDILESIFDILYRYFKGDGDYTIDIRDKINLLPSKNAKLIENMNNFVNYIEQTEYLEAQQLQRHQTQTLKNVYLTKINQLLSNVIPYLDEQLDIYLTSPPVKPLQRRTLKKRISDAPEFNIYISIEEAYLNQKQLVKRQDLVIYLAEKLQKYIAQKLEKTQLENFERIVAKKMGINLHNKTIKRQSTYLKPTQSSSLKNRPKSSIPYKPSSLKMGDKN